MPNRNLSIEEMLQANALLKEIRERLKSLAGNNEELLFAFRRKIYKELTYDERGKPMYRRMLKARKMGEQNGLCSICSNPLPSKYAILDRKSAMIGYTPDNTQLICTICDTNTQIERRYS